MERLGVFLLILIAVMPDAYAALVDTNYVSEYYYKQCANSNLAIPGAGNSNLVGQRYLLGIVDMLNENKSTFAADANDDDIVSVGYLRDTLQKLKDSPVCCLGGYYDNSLADCMTCGEWVVDSTDMCFRAGEYYNNGKCSPCGDGYICDADTSSRVECGPGYYCVANVRKPCPDGVQRCPYATHTAPLDTVGCHNTWVFIE